MRYAGANEPTDGNAHRLTLSNRSIPFVSLRLCCNASAVGLPIWWLMTQAKAKGRKRRKFGVQQNDLDPTRFSPVSRLLINSPLTAEPTKLKRKLHG